jgi:hypothetical protein
VSAAPAPVRPSEAPSTARSVVPPARAADSASSTGRIGPPVPPTSDHSRTSRWPRPEQPAARPRSAWRQARGTPARKSRSGAHAAPDAANPSESTTSALPTVPPRSRGGAARAGTPSDDRSPHNDDGWAPMCGRAFS